MVKVIKYGQKRRVTCNHCGAVLEFDNNDLETYQVDWNEWEKRIKCPACTETVTVSQDLNEENYVLKQEAGSSH